MEKINTNINQEKILDIFTESLKNTNQKDIIFQYSDSKTHSSYKSRMIVFSQKNIVVKKLMNFILINSKYRGRVMLMLLF